MSALAGVVRFTMHTRSLQLAVLMYMDWGKLYLLLDLQNGGMQMVNMKTTTEYRNCMKSCLVHPLFHDLIQNVKMWEGWKKERERRKRKEPVVWMCGTKLLVNILLYNIYFFFWLLGTPIISCNYIPVLVGLSWQYLWWVGFTQLGSVLMQLKWNQKALMWLSLGTVF